MKTTVCVLVILMVWFQMSSAVTVTEEDFQFPLEAVKALGDLMSGPGASADQQVQLEEPKVKAVCSHPDLPQVFKPLCLRRNVGASLARLALVATNYNNCEICEYVGCTGC